MPRVFPFLTALPRRPRRIPAVTVADRRSTERILLSTSEIGIETETDGPMMITIAEAATVTVTNAGTNAPAIKEDATVSGTTTSTMMTATAVTHEIKEDAIAR